MRYFFLRNQRYNLLCAFFSNAAFDEGLQCFVVDFGSMFLVGFAASQFISLPLFSGLLFALKAFLGILGGLCDAGLVIASKFFSIELCLNFSLCGGCGLPFGLTDFVL